MAISITKLKKSLLDYRSRGGLCGGIIVRILKTSCDFMFFCVRYTQYIYNYAKSSARLADGRFECSWKLRWPCLNDSTEGTGFDAHYLYHTSWAARILARDKPEYHVDISSSLTFVSLVSAFVPVKFYDYRPANINLSDLECGFADLMKLPFSDNSVKSLSCMHVVEHVGLGRYGDPFDPQGDLKSVSELIRVLSPGGKLFFVVPIGGKAILQFNAHRVYSYEQILSYFHNMKLEGFALVTDCGDFLENAPIEIVRKQLFGCGCFLFIK